MLKPGMLRTRTLWWMIPIGVLLCCTLPHLAAGDWMRGDGSWYAAIGVQAWRNGSLWPLMEGPGREYLNKPPLGLWVYGLWLWVAGTGGWQARAASIMAAGLCVWAVAGIARVLGGRTVAAVCGALLAIDIEFFRRTREISLDLWNTAFMLLAALALVHALRGARTRWWLVALAGASTGAALLTKPMVGLAAPLIVGAWVVARAWSMPSGRGRMIRGGVVAALVACVVGVAIAAPWHIAMAREKGDTFTSQYFGREIADRVAGQLVGGQQEVKPWWFYLSNIASSWTTWLAALGLLARAGFRARMSGRRASVARFGAAWALAWLVLLTAFPDRRDRYAIPLHAGVALAVGAPITGRRARTRSLLARGSGVLAAGAAVFAVLPVRVQRPIEPQWPALFAWLDRERPAEVWDGSFTGAPAARVYLRTGAWPRTTRDARGALVALPPRGAVILYHRRGGYGPGPGESEVWSQGQLKATRLDAEPWSPTPMADPGE